VRYDGYTRVAAITFSHRQPCDEGNIPPDYSGVQETVLNRTGKCTATDYLYHNPEPRKLFRTLGE
jgi:hypothetical protein